MITCDLKTIKVKDFVNGFENHEEEGAYTNIIIDGVSHRLNLRPAYQREFVYKDKQRDAVIDTMSKNLPLGIVYLAINEKDGCLEVIDGQQRLMSICQYMKGAYSVNGICDFLNDKKFNLERMSDTAIGQKLLNYDKIFFEVIKGDDDEKLEWFRTINIAGEKLEEQELLNANYTGPWLSDAKRRFSKRNCWASKKGEGYMDGEINRQKYLETALDWISDGNIQKYMETHRYDENADELKDYFERVIDWVESIFNYRKEMKGLPWGKLYNQYHEYQYDKKFFEGEVSRLMADEEVTSKKGVYFYLLSGDETKLNLREFDKNQKRTMYEMQHGIDPFDGQHYKIEEMEGHHIIEWSEKGKTILENGVMLSKKNHKNIYSKITPQELRERRDKLINS